MSSRSGAAHLLRQLARIAERYGDGSAGEKRRLLDALARARLATAKQVEQLHEIACLLRAYPDDPDVLRSAEFVLAGFGARADVRALAERLESSGIAGTPIHYQFYWVTARWLARSWPSLLTIDWGALEDDAVLERILHLIVPENEAPDTSAQPYSARDWLELLKGPGETDATFLVRRVDALPMSETLREHFFESIDLPMRLDAGTGTPSRSRAKHPVKEIVFRSTPRSRERPRLDAEVRRPPVAVREVPLEEREALIDLAREAMVTRSRDLDAIAYANPDDVVIVDCGSGLSFACIGVLPERRFLLETLHVFITLMNGVPIGYYQAASIFSSSESNYNVFEPFRGAEASLIYGRAVSMVHHHLGSDAFAVDPYQLGDGNAEAITTGAFWFYYKLGYRPEGREVRRLLRAELDAMKSHPGHRSSPAVLERLAAEHVFYYLGSRRDDVAGKLATGDLTVALNRHLAARFGAAREAGLDVLAHEAERALGLRSLDGFSRDERAAWIRWSPIVALMNVERWTPAERRALVDVIRAKGAPSEVAFGRLLAAHARLRRSLIALIRGRPEPRT